MEKNAIIAMAVAAIAEETNQDIKKVRVKSFREAEKSSLEKYIEANNLVYKKYQLEDEAR